MKVSMIIPTHQDKKGLWEKFFVDTMIPSMVNLKGFDFELLINYQGYTDSNVDYVNHQLDTYCPATRIRHSRKNYKAPVSMCKIREDLCQLNSGADIYLCLDDDFKFNDTKVSIAYQQVASFMEYYEKYGMVMCMGFLGGVPSGNNIIPTNDRIWNTRCGLFLRNPKEVDWLFAPKDGQRCKGGLEESYACYSRLDLGYWGAKRMNVNLTNLSKSRGVEKHNYTAPLRYDAATDIHNPDICDKGIATLIRTKWDDPTWEHGKKKLPKLLARKVKKI